MVEVALLGIVMPVLAAVAFAVVVVVGLFAVSRGGDLDAPGCSAVNTALVRQKAEF